MTRRLNAPAVAVLTMTLFAGCVVAASKGVAASVKILSAVASISVTPSADGLLLTGGVLALTAGDFQAVLAVDKKGKSGSMKTTQGGKLSLDAGESGSVAKVGLSYAPGDTVDVRLDVTSGGRSVSQAHTVIK